MKWVSPEKLCGVGILCGASKGDHHHHRGLSSSSSATTYDPIGSGWTSFQPVSDVKDYQRIEFDRIAINTQLFQVGGKTGMRNAERIFREGAHSFSIAELTLNQPPKKKHLEVGMTVKGKLHADPTKHVTGTLSRIEGYDDEYASRLVVAYDNVVDDDGYVCQVGGLPDPIVDGCFIKEGNITFPDWVNSTKFSYSYKVHENNLNERSISTLGGKWNSLMYDTHSVLATNSFREKFENYYQTPGYSNMIIQSALNQEKMPNSFDFRVFSYDHGLPDIISRAILHIKMVEYVVDELKTAVYHCGSDNAEAGVTRLDKAVAMYHGSMINSAEKACERMHTEENCPSNVVMDHFIKLQSKLQFDECDKAKSVRDSIIHHMVATLIQKTLHVSYLLTHHVPENDGERHKLSAKGSIFALSILPIVADCSVEDAQVLYQNLKPPKHGVVTDYAAVKAALERNYKCMGIKCTQVGSVLGGDINKICDDHDDDTNSTPQLNATLASDDDTAQKGNKKKNSKNHKHNTNIRVLVTLIIVGVLVVVIQIFILVRCYKKSQKEFDTGAPKVGTSSVADATIDEESTLHGVTLDEENSSSGSALGELVAA